MSWLLRKDGENDPTKCYQVPGILEGFSRRFFYVYLYRSISQTFGLPRPSGTLRGVRFTPSARVARRRPIRSPAIQDGSSTSPQTCEACDVHALLFGDRPGNLAHVFYEPLRISCRTGFSSPFFRQLCSVFFGIFGHQEIQNYRRNKQKKHSSTACQELTEHVCKPSGSTSSSKNGEDM